jgi:hypothetical protein
MSSGSVDSDSKTISIIVKNIKVIVALVIFVAVIVFAFYVMNSVNITKTITDYIQDGYGVTYTFNGFGSRIIVILTSNDYMYLKVVVDGKKVYEETNIGDVYFQQILGFGFHTVQIIIQNPSIPVLGPTIQVSGTASISL